jgi:flagella basal body P-ring formation protein FlgA
MRPKTVFSILVATAMLFAAGTSAHELPDVAPFGADRTIPQIDVRAYSVSLEQGDSITFEDTLVKRVWVDEGRLLDVSQADGKITLTGKQPGKVIVRFMHSNKEIVMNDAAKHGVGLFIDTFIVTIGPKT